MPSSVVIEIGPGRGAWTKAILSRGVEKIYAIDAATPEHTGFWDYIGKSDRVDYFVATDFTLREVPDDCADYFFSFGVFCHIAPEHSKEYITSLHRKMRAGSNGFLMIADFSKYNKLRERINDYSLLRMMRKKRMALARFGYRISRFFQPSKFNLRLIAEQGAPRRGPMHGIISVWMTLAAI